MSNEQEPYVELNRSFTEVLITPEIINRAMNAAYWRSCSPHEWDWSKEDQAAMALYCLWAHQRMSILKYVASTSSIGHRKEGLSNGEAKRD
jgi:hypothetical protein